MPRISNEKKDKISEQILFYLFQVSPKLVYTVDIAKETARDEEFIKSLLVIMLKKGLVVKIDKNSKGISYIRRARWRLSNEAYAVYKQHNSQKTSELVEKSNEKLQEKNF